MKQFLAFILLIINIFLFDSCVIPSSEKIQELDQPDNSITEKFGVEVKGVIMYQFYQKYGFTDIEEQLILIVKPDIINLLNAHLPFDSLRIKEMHKIDFRKFILYNPINIDFERIVNEDVRLEAKKYDNGEMKTIYYNEGKYNFLHSDTIETIFVFDNQTGLLYIESKK